VQLSGEKTFRGGGRKERSITKDLKKSLTDRGQKVPNLAGVVLKDRPGGCRIRTKHKNTVLGEEQERDWPSTQKVAGGIGQEKSFNPEKKK